MTSPAAVRVLLVEDSPSDANLIMNMLNHTGAGGFDVCHVSCLEEAVACLTQAAPNAVLLDLGLPDGQGVDSLQRIRAASDTVPIIVVSGSSDDTCGPQAVPEGAQDYLVKEHLDGNVLARTIKHAIARQATLLQLREAIRDARAREADFRKLITKNADGMVLLDADGTVLFMNPAAESLFDRKASDLLGEPFGFPVAAGERTEIEAVRPDKSVRLVEIRGVELEMAGRPLCLASLRDITERKQAEETARRLATVVRDSNDAITVQALGGRIIAWNRGAELMYGYSGEEALQMNIGLLTPPGKEAEQEEFTRRLMAGDAVTSFETQRVSKDGRILDVWLVVTKLVDDTGRTTGIVSTERDITKLRQTTDALRETNEYLESLFNHANAPIIVWDPQFRITRFNHAFESLTGRKAADVLGKPVEILFAPAQAGKSMDLVRKVTGGERWEAAEIDVLHIDGAVRTVLWNSATVAAADGKTPVATIAQGQDITERVQAEAALRESQARFRELAESVPQLVWTCRTDGPCDYLSPQWVEYTGIPEADQLGFGWLNQLHPDDRDRTVAAWNDAVGSNSPFDVEFRIRRKDGTYRWFKTRAVALRDDSGRVTKWSGTSTDIEDRMQAEEEIRKLNENLEKRVAERTVQLEATNRELESFAHSVSHDLRAPLRGIDGFSQMLLEDYTDKLDAQGRSHLSRVRAGTQRMGALIDDLLKLSHITRAEMRKTRVDLSALAQAVADDLRGADPERRVEFVIQEGLAADGDPSLLHVALENLLGNAWKFTGKQEKARIEFGALDHEGARAYFVRDDGVGFDMRYADKLFGAFQRLHAQDEFPGTGIGLATVQRIVRRHGGRVWAEGEVGKGSTFYFALQSEEEVHG